MPALAALLGDKDLAHAARDALEAMPCPEAVQAIREALPKLAGLQKVGAIQSLGTRRDVPSVAALAGLLADGDRQIAAAAAAALGEIGTLEAADALRKAAPAAADALLACAERLAADGKKAEAKAIYAALDVPEQPKHVRLAAARGQVTAAMGHGSMGMGVMRVRGIMGAAIPITLITPIIPIPIARLARHSGQCDCRPNRGL